MTTNSVVDLGDQRFARDVARAHSHGPAFLARMLADWSADRLLRTELEKLFRRAAELDPSTIEITGASDRWPA